jgi:hypothetical protein
VAVLARAQAPLRQPLAFRFRELWAVRIRLRYVRHTGQLASSGCACLIIAVRKLKPETRGLFFDP